MRNNIILNNRSWLTFRIAIIIALKAAAIVTAAIFLSFFISNCLIPKNTDFIYQQNFTPDSTHIISTRDRLVFDDVREEGKLSNWNSANWVLTGESVTVVGSRNREVERREKAVAVMYEGHESNVTIRGFRVHWLTLSMGDLSWTDYVISTTVRPENGTCAGIAFRYLNPREYYAFMLDTKNNKVKLVLRRMDQEATTGHFAWDEIKTVPFQFTSGKTYNISATVQDSRITCQVDGSVVIDTLSNFRKNGKVAFIADDPARFGPVTVKGKMNHGQARSPVRFEKPRHVYSLPLTGGDIQRRMWFSDVDSDGKNEIIISEFSKNKYAYRCIRFDGTELWKIDHIKNPVTEGGDFVIQIFDINGDGKNEVVAAIDFNIEVRDGKTGTLLKSVPTPEQNPYFDSRDYPYDRLLGDALCPVKIRPGKPKGFYLKDRYTNLWMFDNNLNLLWHKAIGTGHFPLPADIDGDGTDEIMVCHTLLKADGRVIWDLPLSDHTDNIAWVSLNPGKENKFFYMAAGEMGLLKVNPVTGKIEKRLELGHIQALTVDDFLTDREGLELMAQTTWREDKIFYLFDKDLKMISTWQPGYSEGGVIYPVSWGENGRDLGIMAGKTSFLIDPVTGDSLYKIGHLVDVFSDSRWGNELVATEENNFLNIYLSQNDRNLRPAKFLFTDFQSGYLPIVNPELKTR